MRLPNHVTRLSGQIATVFQALRKRRLRCWGALLVRDMREVALADWTGTISPTALKDLHSANHHTGLEQSTSQFTLQERAGPDGHPDCTWERPERTVQLSWAGTSGPQKL